MDTLNAPQIIEHISQSLTYTPFDVNWIPCSAKFVVVGQTPGAKGIMQVFQMNQGKLEVLNEWIKECSGFKCSTFGASSFVNREIATGDYDGGLNIYDLEKCQASFSIPKAHKGIINAMDGIGGTGNIGPAEIITAGRDGCAKIWDPRQQTPVVSLEPAESEKVLPECWAVNFGNAYNTEERCVAIGYDNGDVKIYDLRMNLLKWETNLKNGVCALEFDRKDIQMNKLAATTLESKFHVFDLRTLHPELGYAGVSEVAHNSTIWGAKHLPQNRDIFMTLGGNGSMNLYKYNYPNQRQVMDDNSIPKGVAGSLSLLNSQEVTSQPIIAFDWHPDKIGLNVMVALDQSVKVYIVTRLNLY
jgi:WD40 repeat protein